MFPVGSLCFLMPPFSLTGWLQCTSNSFVIRDIFITCFSRNAVSVTFLGGLFFRRPLFGYLLSQLTSCCNISSSVCPSIFWLECRSSSSDTNLRCMDLMVSVVSFFAVEILCHLRNHHGDYCTHCIILATPKPRFFLFPRHSRCVTQRTNGDFDTHAQSRRQDSDVKGTWLLCLGPNDCGRTEIYDCDVCWSKSVRLALLCTLTHLPSLFSLWSRASSQRLFSCLSVPYRDSVQVLSFEVHDGQMPRRSTNVFCSVRSCHIWHGRLHIRQSLCVTDFSRDFVSLWPKTRQG